MPEFEPYRTEAEIQEVVARFENCVYRPEEFVHAKHLTVAAWYFLQYEKEAAKERMRQGLVKFIRHHGKNGYHVTVTEFWLWKVDYVLSGTDRSKDLVGRLNETVKRLNKKDLLFQHFSRKLVESPEAKQGWVEPDLKAMGES